MGCCLLTLNPSICFLRRCSHNRFSASVCLFLRFLERTTRLFIFIQPPRCSALSPPPERGRHREGVASASRFRDSPDYLIILIHNISPRGCCRLNLKPSNCFLRRCSHNRFSASVCLFLRFLERTTRLFIFIQPPRCSALSPPPERGRHREGVASASRFRDSPDYLIILIHNISPRGCCRLNLKPSNCFLRRCSHNRFFASV